MEFDRQTMNNESRESIFDNEKNIFNGIYFDPFGGMKASVGGDVSKDGRAFFVNVIQKGFKLEIEITFDLGDNAGSLSVLNDSFEPVDFGQKSNEGRAWTGVFPQSGVYYICVTGDSFEPDTDYASFTLQIQKSSPDE